MFEPPPQQTNVDLDYFSAVPVPIRMMQDDMFLGPATGFVIEKDGSNYLISNWHVFSGRNAYSGQPLLPTGAIPNRFELMLHLEKVGDYRKDIQLSIVSPNGTPNWFQHQSGQTYDIAAIRLPSVPDEIKIYPANKSERNRGDLLLQVTSEVFILGYPRGLQKQGILPVWKRGTIAAEPDVPVDGQEPAYLVDTATREGMSGSPVILRYDWLVPLKEGGFEMRTGSSIQLIGVYSGRFGAEDEFAAQLGRVWKISAVEEMITDPAAASYKIIKQTKN
ncbi:S1 family peptidase [Roseobacter sp. A03A-229]